MLRQVGRLRLAAAQDAGRACYSTLERSRCLSDTDRIYLCELVRKPNCGTLMRLVISVVRACRLSRSNRGGAMRAPPLVTGSTPGRSTGAQPLALG